MLYFSPNVRWQYRRRMNALSEKQKGGALVTGPDETLEIVRYPSPWLHARAWEIVHPSETNAEAEEGLHRWHVHPEVELLAVTEGGMGIDTKERRYWLEAGDVLLLGSSAPHRSRKPSYVRYTVLQFHMGKMLDSTMLAFAPLLLELSAPLTRMNDVFEHDPAVRRQTFELIESIRLECEQRQPGHEIAVSGYIRLLLLRLVRSPLREELIASSQATLIRLLPVLRYIERHAAEPLHVRDVLPLVHLSYHHFVRLFKQTMGMSFLDYVHWMRVRIAERLLLANERMPLEEVRIAAGFASSAQFYKIFTRYYGCAPAGYRKRLQQTEKGGE